MAAGDPRFHEQLKKMGELHDRKQEDYGTDGDPFANVRASQEFGVPPWMGAIIRLNDKITRIKSFAKKGNLANESLEDSLDDIAVYAVIAKVLYLEPDPSYVQKAMHHPGPSNDESSSLTVMTHEDIGYGITMLPHGHDPETGADIIVDL